MHYNKVEDDIKFTFMTLILYFVAALRILKNRRQSNYYRFGAEHAE